MLLKTYMISASHGSGREMECSPLILLKWTIFFSHTWVPDAISRMHILSRDCLVKWRKRRGGDTRRMRVLHFQKKFKKLRHQTRHFRQRSYKSKSNTVCGTKLTRREIEKLSFLTQRTTSAQENLWNRNEQWTIDSLGHTHTCLFSLSPFLNY